MNRGNQSHNSFWNNRKVAAHKEEVYGVEMQIQVLRQALERIQQLQDEEDLLVNAPALHFDRPVDEL